MFLQSVDFLLQLFEAGNEAHCGKKHNRFYIEAVGECLVGEGLLCKLGRPSAYVVLVLIVV